MENDRWNRIEALYHSAAKLPSGEWHRYLAVACGPDAELIGEVRSLLEHGKKTNSFIECPAIQRAAEILVDEEGGSVTTSGPTEMLAFPAPDWDRYEFQKILGQGGMGVVYLARERTLNRPTALKFLRETDKGQLGRFLREARSQAQITHEGVCKVFEVGEVNGRSFIAMEYIEGESLDLAHKELPLDRRVLIIKRTAEALAAAHQLGIIHRDIKPSNIMVSTGPDGQPFPVLMDFGLARDTRTESSLTETGAIMGTPAFMSPEQAGGGVADLDRRTDIYSLGSTMYAILCGRPPFVASSNILVLLKVLHDDPEPPARYAPNLPADLQTIVLKCLEKDPGRRYDSARALAEDLDRYLSGQPINALRPTFFQRLKKKVARNRVATGAILLGLVFGFFFSAYAIRSEARAREQARLAQEFGEMAERTESYLRFAHMMPPHDIRRETGLVASEVERIKRRMAEAGSLATGPGEYALGRASLALGDFREASKHLAMARQVGFRSPGLDFAEGRVLGELYKAARPGVEADPDPQNREFRRRQLEARFLVPAINLLSSYRDRTTNTPEMPFIEGLLALYQRDFANAIRHAERAQVAQPWNYEACLLESEACLSLAQEKANSGVEGEAEAFRRKAGEAIARGNELGRSDPAVVQSEARRWLNTLNDHFLNGKPLEEPFARTLAACDRVLVLQPEHAEAYICKAFCYGHFCSRQVEKGIRLGTELQTGLAAAREAVRLDPFNGDSHRSLSKLLVLGGEDAENSGQSPLQWFDQAVTAGREAVRLTPGSALSRQNLAYLLMVRGLGKSGEDPRPDFQEAEGQFRESIRISPKNVRTLTYQASLFLNRGSYEMGNGRDPRPDYSQAVQTYLKALEVNSKYHLANKGLSEAYLKIGEYQASHGIDPRDQFEKSVEEARKAIEANPNNPRLYFFMVKALLARGTWEAGQGIHPARTLEMADGADHQIMASSQNFSSEVFLDLGNTRLILGEFEARTGKDPERTLSEAVAHFRKAATLAPQATLPLAGIVKACCQQARWRLENGRSPVAPLKEARSALACLARLSPKGFADPAVVIQVELTAADVVIRQKRSPLPFLGAAERALNQCFQGNRQKNRIDPLIVEVNLYKAEWAMESGNDPKHFLQTGLAAVERLSSGGDIRWAAASGRYHLLQATVAGPEQSGRTRLADLAIASFTKAISDSPSLKGELLPLIEKARRLKGI